MHILLLTSTEGQCGNICQRIDRHPFQLLNKTHLLILVACLGILHRVLYRAIEQENVIEVEHNEPQLRAHFNAITIGAEILDLRVLLQSETRIERRIEKLFLPERIPFVVAPHMQHLGTRVREKLQNLGHLQLGISDFLWPLIHCVAEVNYEFELVGFRWVSLVLFPRIDGVPHDLQAVAVVAQVACFHAIVRVTVLDVGY